MKTKLFKVKQGKLEMLREWLDALSTYHRDEAIDTLREEHVTREAVYLFKMDLDWFAVGFTEGEGILPSSDSELNKKHRQVLKECFESAIPGESGYDLMV